MYSEHPIICPHCKRDTGMTEEDYMHDIFDQDINCSHCGKVVVSASKIEYTENAPNMLSTE